MLLNTIFTKDYRYPNYNISGFKNMNEPFHQRLLLFSRERHLVDDPLNFDLDKLRVDPCSQAQEPFCVSNVTCCVRTILEDVRRGYLFVKLLMYEIPDGCMYIQSLMKHWVRTYGTFCQNLYKPNTKSVWWWSLIRLSSFLCTALRFGGSPYYGLSH